LSMTITELKQKWLASYGLLAERVLKSPSKRSAFGEDPLGEKERKRKPRSKDTLRHHFRGGSPLSLREDEEAELSGQVDTPTTEEPERKRSVPFGRDTVGKFPDAAETGETIGGQQIPDVASQLEQGIEYEMGKMVKPDRSMAVDTAVANLRTNPRYYMDLVMLGLQERKEQQKEALQSILGDMIQEREARAASSARRNLQEAVRTIV